MTLFDPFTLGAELALRNRVAMAPMTRCRARNEIADELTAAYYAQRASAGLIVTEGTFISESARGYICVPGIWSGEQIKGWRLVTEAVHQQGGAIFAQIWHVGRVSHTSLQPSGQRPLSSSGVHADSSTAFIWNGDGTQGFAPVSEPRAMTRGDIAGVITDFARAATNAINAGFDGVEIHGANGYLLEQFMNPHVNLRDDIYDAKELAGRLRFTLDVVDAVTTAIGPNKVGIRLSPYGTLYDNPLYPEIEETYLTLGAELSDRQLAYVHLMDQASRKVGREVAPIPGEFIERFRTAFTSGALILAGGMTKDKATALIQDGVIDLAAFGRPFIANPDLVQRLESNKPLAGADPATAYGGGAKGYIDYPSLDTVSV